MNTSVQPHNRCGVSRTEVNLNTANERGIVYLEVLFFAHVVTAFVDDGWSGDESGSSSEGWGRCT
jgi:hypothetical protein